MRFVRPMMFVAVLLAGASLRAEDAKDSQPYATIVSRNMFGLVPIPVADTNPAVVEDPPPKITPSGIMNLFGKLQVLFKVAAKPKPGQPATEDSYVLSEGERQDEIEVTKIDEPAASVTFNNHGLVQTLTLELAKGPAGGGPAPGGPAGGGPGNLPMRPGGGGPGGPGGGFRPGGNMGVFPPNRNEAPPNTGNPGMPSFGGGMAGGGNNVQPQQPEALTPEAQIIAIEAQRQMAVATGDPVAPILPPPPPQVQKMFDGGNQGNPTMPPMPQ